MSDKECDAFIEYGRGKKLERSRGFNPETGICETSDYRTSWQLFIPRDEASFGLEIEQRIAEATGTRVEWGEAFQLCHYPAGTYYKAHHDYFHMQYEASAAAAERAGQRIITFMVYLNTLPVDGGGETNFMYSNVWVRPEKGKAVIFFNLMPDGRVDESTYHEALPPCEGFEKWIINKWIHARPFI